MKQAQQIHPVFRLPEETTFTPGFLEFYKSQPQNSTKRYTDYPGAALHRPIKPPKKMIAAAMKLLKR